MSTTYNADDLESDINHLSHLLDALVELMQGMDHDKSGVGDQYRADALAWIARDMADQMVKHLAAPPVRMTGGGRNA